MKIALIGYGKMGKAIEEIALKRRHEIVLKIDVHNVKEFNNDNLKKADVAIEFTSPQSAFDNVKKCLESGTALVCGSTGWLERWGEIKSIADNNHGALVYSSNYSIGVNIFFEINKRLADLMSMHEDYDVSMEEIHHTQKKDAPSGTAVTLADQVLERIPRKKTWVNHISDNPDELAIISERIDPAPGTHKVKYSSAIDDLEIIHTAHNRTGFATGAVLAAEFIKGRKGIYSMKEVLGL
jgi:4-hydroxy-tetrahydrodipicolinate reductase